MLLESMPAGVATGVIAYALFAGLLSFSQQAAMRAHPEDLSELEVTMWRADTPFAAFASVFGLVVRVNGIALFGACLWQYGWVEALLCWAAGMGLLLTLGAFLRYRVGAAPAAIPAFVALPILGTVLWFAVFS